MAPKLKTCNLITALICDKYINYQFKIDEEEGSLYLVDGTKKTVKVDLMNKGSNYITYENRDQFFKMISKNTGKTSFSEEVKRLIKTKFEENHCLGNMHLVDAYSKSCGMPKVTIKKDNLEDILKNCESLGEVRSLCSGNLSENAARKLVALTFNLQQKMILDQISFNDPDTLRTALTDLLIAKGLTYEAAISQFDWSKGSPSKNAIEGSYVLAKLIAQVDAWKAIRSKNGGKNFPFEDVWRFCIDEAKEKYGAYFFENEPFYILSSLRGLKEIINSKEEPSQKTYESFAASLMRNPPIMKHAIQIHNDLMANEINKNETHYFFSNKMTSDPGKFNASLWKYDCMGVEDLEKRSKAQINAEERIDLSDVKVTDEEYFLANATGFRKCGVFIYGLTKTTSNIIAQRIFLGLENILELSKTPGERLIAYIWAARELEVTHQLDDGNGRTSIAFLINRIANDSDLPMYIPQDPNILDQQAPEALLRDIHQGMRHFVELSHGNPDSVIDVETLLNQAGVKGQTWDVVHQRAKLSKEQVKRLVEEDKKAIANAKNPLSNNECTLF